MKFNEGEKLRVFGKFLGFVSFAIIFSTVLTFVSRFTKMPDLYYSTALLVTSAILMTGFLLGKALE